MYYDVNFKVKCSDPLGGYDIYSIPCANLDVALSLAAFLSKINHELGSKISYEDLSVEPSNSN